MKIKKILLLVVGIASILFLLSPQIIFAEDELLTDLSITCPSQVNESFPFNVTIKSNATFLANVTVTFNGEINRTNSFGTAGFYAPRVLPDEDNTYTIIATKPGYNETIAQVTVLNVPQVFPTVSTSHIFEKTLFVITVIDDEGSVVDNATVMFDNKEYFSSSNGAIELVAPAVNKSKTYVISVTKPGYIDYSTLIVVSPSFSFENLIGFFVVIGICIIIIVAVIVIMLLKHLRKKRINRF